MSFTLSQLSELTESFRLLNTSDSAILTPQQILRTMHSFGYTSTSLSQIEYIVGQYDTDNKGGWDATQFISYLFHHLVVIDGMGHASAGHNVESAPKSRHRQLMDEIFETYDVMNRGYITKDDIVKIMTTVNEPVNDAILHEMMDGKDRISRGEFHEMMRGEIAEGLLDAGGAEGEYEWEGEEDEVLQKDTTQGSPEEIPRNDSANEISTFAVVLEGSGKKRDEVPERVPTPQEDPFEDDIPYEGYDD